MHALVVPPRGFLSRQAGGGGGQDAWELRTKGVSGRICVVYSPFLPSVFLLLH